MSKTIRKTSRNKLYLFPEPIRLTYMDIGIRVNLPMNRFQPKVFKGNLNTIEFIVQDSDRKPINLLDKSLTALVQNVTNNNRVLKRDLEVIDAQEGQARLNLYPTDIDNWIEGFYAYTVEFSSESGQRGFTYTDQGQNAIGYFELRSGTQATPTESYVAKTEDFSPSGITYLGSNTIFITSAWPGNVLSGDLNTVAVWTTDYLGTIEVEVTLDETSPTDDPDRWTTVVTLDYTDSPQTGVTYRNFYGNFNYVRIKHDPAPLNEGQVDKVHYRP